MPVAGRRSLGSGSAVPVGPAAPVPWPRPSDQRSELDLPLGLPHRGSLGSGRGVVAGVGSRLASVRASWLRETSELVCLAASTSPVSPSFQGLDSLRGSALA